MTAQNDAMTHRRVKISFGFSGGGCFFFDATVTALAGASCLFPMASSFAPNSEDAEALANDAMVLSS